MERSCYANPELLRMVRTALTDVNTVWAQLMRVVRALLYGV
jgi:hypothetical protein